MFASFLILFRETLEAALIVGIVLAYLQKTKNSKYNNIVYTGVGAGILASFVTAILFNILLGGFTGIAEEIFEGVAMLFGAFLITTVILWMMNQKNVAEDIKQKVSIDIKHKDRLGLFLLVFISVLREGVETVIFLGSASLVNGTSLFGSLLGIGSAIFLGYLIFVASVKVNIKKFFNFSSFLLILFAAGLVAHGIHELQEAHIVPTIIEHVWDVNSIIDENGVTGSILKVLFGYNGNPSLIEVSSYLVYIGIVFGLYGTLKKKSYQLVKRD